MTGVTVRFFANLREAAGSKSVQVEAEDVGSMVEILIEKHPELGDEMLDEKGELKDTVKIMVDGRNIDFLEGLHTKIDKTKKVAVFPLIAGG